MPLYVIDGKSKMDSIMAEIRKYFTVEQVCGLAFNEKGELTSFESTVDLETAKIEHEDPETKVKTKMKGKEFFKYITGNEFTKTEVEM